MALKLRIRLLLKRRHDIFEWAVDGHRRKIVSYELIGLKTLLLLLLDPKTVKFFPGLFRKCIIHQLSFFFFIVLIALMLVINTICAANAVILLKILISFENLADLFILKTWTKFRGLHFTILLNVNVFSGIYRLWAHAVSLFI